MALRARYDLLQSSASATQRVMSSQDLIKAPQAPATIIEDDPGNVFGALGAVLGYIGAEAATGRILEDLLWPQRSFSNFRMSQTPWRVLLQPMGGPMHKAALKVFDVMYRNDIFNGPNQGHMLGTAFFPEVRWSYTMHGQGLDADHTEPLRNCIWAQVARILPMLEPKPRTKGGPKDEEVALKRPHNQSDVVRARFRVNHLTITKATLEDKHLVRTFIHEPTQSIKIRTVMSIVASELTAVTIGLAVAIWYRTPWALLWIIPVTLRLLCASLAVEREPLTDLTSSTGASDPHCDFEVHSPETQPNFLLITGPPAIVLQFSRHYGHPKRNRVREFVQLAVVAAFACLFPLELLCSTVWMTQPVQKIWLSYKLYCVLAMHVTRYSRAGSSSNTVDALAEALSNGDLKFDETGSSSERCILFGHTRAGVETLKINLTSTYHRRYKHAKEAMDHLVTRHRMPASPLSSGTDITLTGADFPDETYVKQD